MTKIEESPYSHHLQRRRYVYCLMSRSGTIDRGETIEAAIANLKEATKLDLEECPLPEISPRFVTTIAPQNF
ncbi:MAG TPA: hypothetical protein VK211_11010 [Kamptonema sp.]|nr:hypothetical protein [Kamptonema sp.]